MSLGAWKSSAAVLLLFLSGTRFLIAAQPETQPQRKSPLATRDLAAQVRKSLVVVLTQDHEGNLIAQGSGFFFKPGFVATNLHVLKRASQGYVKSLSDGVSYKISSVVGFDLKHDVCVLKLSETSGVPLPLSMDAVAVGDDILVAGNPEGLEASFSKGIVSGIRSGSGLIQMDAAISPGSSGGPVVNQRGEVIGLSVSSLVEGQNLNFAVPVRYLREQKLVWKLDVKTAGGLAVPDLERDGLHGQVRSVTESQAPYSFDTRRSTYVEGPSVPTKTWRYNRDEQLEEITSFSNGVEKARIRCEYSDDGLIRRHSGVDNQGQSEFREFSPEDAAIYMGRNAHFDDDWVFGTKGDHDFAEHKYESSGHLIESSFPQQGIKLVMKYDSLGREVEKSEYRQDRLDSVKHSKFEANQRGDWIKVHETIWTTEHPESGFVPSAEFYREITYWGEGEK
jgi:hypothetical protein